MNKPNRTTHEGRQLWTICPLPPAEGEALMHRLAGDGTASHSPPLAAAQLAGASRVCAVIGPEGATPLHSFMPQRAGAPEASEEAGPVILFSHAPPVDRLAPTRRTGTSWVRLGCPGADGQEDVLLLRFDAAPPEPSALKRALADWPALRRQCLDMAPAQTTPQEELAGPDSALLWMILSKIPAAVLVVNPAGLILRMNHQARRLIREGQVLARGRGGLTAASDQGTRLLRAAVKSTLVSIKAEHTLLLPTSDGSRVPATLSRFPAGGLAEPLVTLMIPVPPEPDQVERVARSLGLTTTEAKVAALLQRGLSNRVAALCMGVQEQSFATYSKRVLSKLNVTSRAEIAQMLTWQSSLPSTEGPMS